jgi:Flp pilus assembly protein TadD, contains TPR repeats
MPNDARKKHPRASLASQLGDEPCALEDAEEIFWLRELDDYRSRVALGDALSAQYRFREAVKAYRNALRIRSDDWRLMSHLAGADLTLRRFDDARAEYLRCLSLGANQKSIAYPLGVWHYLQGDYAEATARFGECLPCGDETAIAAIYWHTLSCYRAGLVPVLLKDYRQDMKVGHHTAYQLAVSVFCNELPWEQALRQAEQDENALNAVVAIYGLCGYLSFIGKKEESMCCLKQVLMRDSVWPCISYLAAWNDYK